MKSDEAFDAITAANQLALGGDYAAARAQLESALVYYNDDARTRATLLNNLASMYSEAGDYDHAEKSYRDAVAAAQEPIRGGDFALLIPVTNLFGLYLQYGQLAKADRFRRQLDDAIGRGWRIAPHINVARLYSLCGSLALRLGKYNEAEPLLLHAAEIFNGIKPRPELDLAALENNLAMLYRFMGNIEKAREYVRRASDTLCSLDQIPPGLVALVLVNRALLEEIGGASDDAKQMFERGIKIAQTQVSPIHPIMADILGVAAEYLTLAGNKHDAKRLAKRAASVQDAISHNTSIGKTVDYESFRSRVR